MFPRKILIAASCAALLAGCAASASLHSDNGVLVDGAGRTVYTFDKDVANSGKSACNGPCAALWPAVPSTGMGLSPPYAEVMRDDGSRQLSYKGQPLYLYSADRKPGDRSGDHFKDVWHVVQQ